MTHIKAWRCLRPVRCLLALLLAMTSLSAQAWWNHDWAYRKAITLDAAALGAATDESTVLIRLHEGVLRFTDVAPGGADLRFIGPDDKTPLKYHIERYDEVFNLAFVWVRVPKLKPGEPLAIWMYYGNAKAAAEDDPRGTYDSKQALVWHLSERGGTAKDSSGNGNHGTATYSSVDSGLIGGAARTEQSAILVPASTSTAVAAQSSMSWSLWVKPSEPTANGVILSQQDNGAGLQLSLQQGLPVVTVGELRLPASEPLLDAEHWHHLAVVADGTQLLLYVDGVVRAQAPAMLPALQTSLVLGGDNSSTLAPSFKGQIDEFQISRSALTPVQLKLAALNQGTEDKLVSFGVDEGASTWSSGYVGIILGSVTFDGWVVIIILALMMVASWIIMARKGSQIGRARKGNRQFLELYRSTGQDLVALHQQLHGKSDAVSPREQELLAESPLMAMFNTGVQELQRRINDASRGAQAQGLSAQSIEAIRATVDASFVTQQQSLNSQLVLLTIAVSGGPFIGLLGTVVGVMITFAGVAAAGDVNINAIAPGISAALAATVAGMMVAIPALFGYNYLLTRIKEVLAEMQVFVDAFISRMAEDYDKPAALHALAD